MKKGLKYYLCILGSQLMWPRLALRWKKGLLSFNDADSDSPVLVTVDYYLTVHRVIDSIERQNLKCHLLVVDGKGINVWCGSRGGHVDTDAVLNAINECDLESKVSHRNLILPQLIASAVSKIALQKNGWKSFFGPVDIDDVGEFIKNDYKKKQEQNLIKFPLHKRFEENIGHLVFETVLFLIMSLVFWLLSYIGGLFVSWYSFWNSNLLFIIIGIYILGTFMAIFDPSMPTSSGLVRGIITGLLALIVWKFYLLIVFSTPLVWLDVTGLTILGLSMFIGFNWGGATPYLGSAQMTRDIIVGLLGLVMLFILGYFIPAGIF